MIVSSVEGCTVNPERFFPSQILKVQFLFYLDPRSKMSVRDSTGGFMLDLVRNQDPVVQSIVSLTISLKHKFVKQISAKVTNTLLFFVGKM